MIDRRAQRDSSISIFRIIAVACAICVLVYFIFALVTGIEPIATVIACALLCIFLCIFIFLYAQSRFGALPVHRGDALGGLGHARGH